MTKYGEAQSLQKDCRRYVASLTSNVFIFSVRIIYLNSNLNMARSGFSEFFLGDLIDVIFVFFTFEFRLLFPSHHFFYRLLSFISFLFLYRCEISKELWRE